MSPELWEVARKLEVVLRDCRRTALWYYLCMGHKTLRWVAGAKTPSKIYITRVFNFGTWDEWRRLKKRYALMDIRAAVRHPLRGQWTARGKAFAEVLFGCRMSKKVLISYGPEA